LPRTNPERFADHPDTFDREPILHLVIIRKGRQVRFEVRQPPLDVEGLRTAADELYQRRPELVGLLPPDHPWGKAKLDHADQVSDGASEVLAALDQQSGQGLNSLLLLLGLSHDLGRPILGAIRLGRELPDQYCLEAAENSSADINHGHYSAQVLKAWGLLDLLDQNTRLIVEYALARHANPGSPEPPPDDRRSSTTELERFQIAVTWLLRDADKLATFREKTQGYLFDKEEKRRQIKANGLGGEKFAIEPSRLLDEFANQRPISRDQCDSYEAYMLQFLSWIFDVNFVEVLGKIANQAQLGLHQPAPIESLLRYFGRQLPYQDYLKISDKTKQYLEGLASI